MARHLEDRLTAFIHGEVDRAEARAIEEHLAGCETCREVYAMLQGTDALVAGRAVVEAPDDLWPSIEERLGEPSRGEARRWVGAVALAALLIAALAVGLLIDSSRSRGVPDLEIGAFLAALESAPRQPDSREFGLLPEGFVKIDETAAAEAVGLGSEAGGPAPGSELYVGRALGEEDLGIYQLIYGDDDGAYVVFALPGSVSPDFDGRPLFPCPDLGPACKRVASPNLFVFWHSAPDRQWILVGRDHPEDFYVGVLRSLSSEHRKPSSVP